MENDIPNGRSTVMQGSRISYNRATVLLFVSNFASCFSAAVVGCDKDPVHGQSESDANSATRESCVPDKRLEVMYWKPMERAVNPSRLVNRRQWKSGEDAVKQVQ